MKKEILPNSKVKPQGFQKVRDKHHETCSCGDDHKKCTCSSENESCSCKTDEHSKDGGCSCDCS